MERLYIIGNSFQFKFCEYSNFNKVLGTRGILDYYLKNILIKSYSRHSRAGGNLIVSFNKCVL